MILLIVPDYFWGSKKSCASKILQRILLLLNKDIVLLIMAVIMILRITQVSTLDVVSTHTTTTLTIVSSALLAPPTSNTNLINITSNKLISIPADEILNAEDSEDYIEESVELYDELINNKSGKHKIHNQFNIYAQLTSKPNPKSIIKKKSIFLIFVSYFFLSYLPLPSAS